MVKEKRVGEVLEELQESFAAVKEHQNLKRIQAAEFQNDLSDESVRVLQIDYAMAYQCELQKEAMGVLCTRGSVNLFTCTIYHQSVTKTMMFCTNYKGKDKLSTGLFLDMLWDLWSDGKTHGLGAGGIRFKSYHWRV